MGEGLSWDKWVSFASVCTGQPLRNEWEWSPRIQVMAVSKPIVSCLFRTHFSIQNSQTESNGIKRVTGQTLIAQDATQGPWRCLSHATKWIGMGILRNFMILILFPLNDSLTVPLFHDSFTVKEYIFGRKKCNSYCMYCLQQSNDEIVSQFNRTDDKSEINYCKRCLQRQL